MVDAMDRDGVKTVLPKGAIGYDDYAPGGDVGRIYIGTGTVNIPLAKKDDEATLGTPIASAATVTIGTAGLGDYFHITGTTTITSFGAASAGIRRTLIFDGALTLTHNATSLICMGGGNITTVAGMVIEVVAETTANWRVVSITHPSISATELGYLDGVTSDIQTQINGKADINANTTGSSGSCTGNSATATKLATARTIGGVSFDGTAAINLPGVDTAGNQNTSGNAGSATVLQTARTIAISGDATGTATSFNGSANIAIPVTLGTVPVTKGGTGVTTSTGTGSVVLNTSPTLVTPALGTPSSGNLANCTFPTLNQNTTGSAGSATTLIGDETSWASYRTRAVSNMLSWKNYGNGHCIFDASAGTAPNGVAVNNTNPTTPWGPSYPTLMGWNGGQTYGVRVDSCRIADNVTNLGTTITAAITAQKASSTVYGVAKISVSGSTLTITTI